jgi:hypothetical protein
MPADLFRTGWFPLRAQLACARLMLLSRFSLPSRFPPSDRPFAALCVQNEGVARRVIQDIVFSCLTPAQFDRYSSSDLCHAALCLRGFVAEG